MLHGRALYRDVWDHKPPVVHVLDMIAFRVWGEDFTAIRRMERWFGAIGALLFFLLGRAVLRSAPLALLTTVLCQLGLYWPDMIEGGNLTEEYGVVFLSAGCLCSVLAARAQGPGRWLLASLCGGALALACLTKEPFLFPALPWAGYTVWVSGNRWRERLAMAAAMAGGAALPVIAFASYLVGYGVVRDWADVFLYNLQYARQGHVPLADRLWLHVHALWSNLLSLSKTCLLLAALGLLAMVASRAYLKALRHLPLVAALCLVGGLFGAMTSYYAAAQYYLMCVPGFVLLAGCGGAFLRHLRSAGRWRKALLPALVVILVTVVLDMPVWQDFAKRIARPFQTRQIDSVAAYVRAHTGPNDPIWVCGSRYSITHVYVDAGRLSPTKYHYSFVHLFLDTALGGTGAAKMNSIRSDLERNPPKMIAVCDDMDDLRPGPIPDWIEQNYKVTKVMKGFLLDDVKVHWLLLARR